MENVEKDENVERENIVKLSIAFLCHMNGPLVRVNQETQSVF